MTYDEAKKQHEKLTASRLRRCAIIAEGRAAELLTQVSDDPVYEQCGRLTAAAELLRAADTIRGRAGIIELVGRKSVGDQ